MIDLLGDLADYIVTAVVLVFLLLFLIPVVLLSLTCIILLEIPKLYALGVAYWEERHDRHRD